MRVDIVIYEDNILSATTHCIMIGEKPTLKKVREIIKNMVTNHGNEWTTEPVFDYFEEKVVVEWEEARKEAEKIAPKYFSKIF